MHHPLKWLLLVSVVLPLGCAKTTTKVNTEYTFQQRDRVGVNQAPLDPEEAIIELQAYIVAEPDNPRHYFELGMVYEGLGQYDLAIHYYRELTRKITPNRWTGPYYRLGFVLALDNQLDAAIVELERCIAVQQQTPDVYVMNKDYREAHFLLGQIHYMRNNTDEMRYHFSMFKKRGGEERRISRFLALLLEKQSP